MKSMFAHKEDTARTKCQGKDDEKSTKTTRETMRSVGLSWVNFFIN